LTVGDHALRLINRGAGMAVDALFLIPIDCAKELEQ